MQLKYCFTEKGTGISLNMKSQNLRTVKCRCFYSIFNSVALIFREPVVRARNCDLIL